MLTNKRRGRPGTMGMRMRRFIYLKKGGRRNIAISYPVVCYRKGNRYMTLLQQLLFFFNK